MRIFAMVKTVGKRKPVLDQVPYEVSDTTATVKELLTEIVHIEVKKYNEKKMDVQMLTFLTKEEVDAQAETGKVSFGRIYSEKKADEQRAVDNVLQCFGDGLIRIFQNEEERKKLDERIQIQEGDCFTFIRLTFLAGRMW